MLRVASAIRLFVPEPQHGLRLGRGEGRDDVGDDDEMLMMEMTPMLMTMMVIMLV